MTDIVRNLQTCVEGLLASFPVVLIVGARQSGKTTLAKACRPDWTYYDLEKGSDFDFISRDFDFFFREHPNQVIFDEAQELPRLFKELRGVIDADRSRKNRFILTGSSSPELLTEAADSLAGRLAIIETGTLKTNERFAAPLPPFYRILETPLGAGTIADLLALQPAKWDAVEAMLWGGYPEPVLAADPGFWSQWMEAYFQTYINRDVRKLFPRLDSVKFRRFIGILSSMSGTLINKAAIARALDINEVTARDYLDIAHNTFVWRQIPAWENSELKSLVKMPKGIFRDSGLSHFLANISSRAQLLHSSMLGFNFEAFVIEELLKGMQASSASHWQYSYYRTRGGAEIDLILEGTFGMLPVEIKFGTHVQLKQLTALRGFITDRKLPLGIVINNAEEVKLICDRVVQLPVQCL
jgi:uncharacterized protein